MASFRRAASGLYAAHLGAQELHPEHVEGLSADVLGAHVDDALLAQHGAHGGRGDAVLSRPGLGDYAVLAHAPGKYRLSQGVVDLVGAGVGKVLPFQVYLGPAQLSRQVLRVVEGCWPSHVVGGEACQLGPEGAVRQGVAVGVLQLRYGAHQGLGDEAAAVAPEVPRLVRHVVASLHRSWTVRPLPQVVNSAGEEKPISPVCTQRERERGSPTAAGPPKPPG